MAKKKLTIATEAIHLTSEDGTKTLAQLIDEQSSGTPLPESPISKLHFLVDPLGDTLIFPRVEGFQPEGFQWAILPGQDKKFKTTRIDLSATEELQFFLVRTETVCNFLVIFEFYE